MEYLTVDQARVTSGLRLVLTAGMPGPWSESAKQIFDYKRIAFHPVAQHLFEDNADLADWTGVRNAPVAINRDEAPKHGWREILELAERLAPFPALIPADPNDRATVLELSSMICGKDGFGWNRRLTLFAATGDIKAATDLQRFYGLDENAAVLAPGRLGAILQVLADRLHRQFAMGRRVFVGNTVSACDLYWACFSLMVRPVSPEWAPIPPAVRELYGTLSTEISDALDDILLVHRDNVFTNYIRLPLDF